MSKILVVEDDMDINNLLAKILKKQGYEVVQAFSGSEAALRLGLEESDGSRLKEYSMILLDLMLPGMMGEDVLSRIRSKSQVPVMVLSAKSALEDRVNVLNMGADDYLVKPFENDEVVARVSGAVRRYERYQSMEEPDRGNAQSGPAANAQEMVGTDSDETICYRKLVLRMREREAVLNGENLKLTGHEFDILCTLVNNPGKVYSRENLYEEIWQGGYYGEDNTVNMHISNLRKKMAAVVEEEYIKTVWGIGYKLV